MEPNSLSASCLCELYFLRKGVRLSQNIEDLVKRLRSVAAVTPMGDGLLFDNVDYLINHLDVLQSGMDPYDHYLRHGKFENRAYKTVELVDSHQQVFAIDQMKLFPNKFEMIQYFAEEMDFREGTAIEFGVFSGSTLSAIRKNFSGLVIGFDSFDGLPEDWRDGFSEGTFATQQIPKIENSIIVIGVFQQTLPAYLNSFNGTINLVHFDADLYSSTAFCLHEVTKYLADESIFIFDEYHNYPGWEEHEHKAFVEWLAANRDFSAYEVGLVIGGNQEQKAFRIRRSMAM
jgi:hypothetical protein